MARIRKNMYKMSFGKSVGVMMDESLMKKMVKLQYETQEKILELLENNPDNYTNYSWTIAEEPSEIEQHNRVCYYIDKSPTYSSLEERTRKMFGVTKVKDLYDVGNLKYNEAMEQAEKEHTKHLMKTRQGE